MSWAGRGLVGGLACMAVVCALPVSARARAWGIGAVYAFLLGVFYCDSWLTTVALSDRYRLLTEELRLPAAASGLHQSWLSGVLGGRPMDLKDAQYHDFHDALPWLCVGLVVHVGGGRLVRLLSRGYPRRQRVLARASFGAAFGVAAALGAHEAGALKLLALASGNFALSRMAMRSAKGHWATPALLWGVNLSVLFFNDRFRGYRFAHLLGPSELAFRLDAMPGALPWHHSFNFVMLRMMSYNMDCWWRARGRSSESPLWREESDVRALQRLDVGRDLGERARVSHHHPATVHGNFVVYLCYLLYVPLYIAGPTITYNCFVSHLALPQQTYGRRDKVAYFLRFAATLLLFEVMTHFMYVGALSYMAFRFKPFGVPVLMQLTMDHAQPHANAHANAVAGGGEVGGEGEGEGEPQMRIREVVYYSYWALMYLWFKFTLIWRFFRLWALCDDVEPVENMERCMNNNYTIGGFWRAWHRSFNRWLVRYVYVPMGGGKGVGPARRALNVFVVFSFVSFWHDQTLQLFAWGWLLSLAMLPEIAADQVAKMPRVKAALEAHPMLAEAIVAFCGAINIVMLKVANIVGYTTGLEGAAMLIPVLGTAEGFAFATQYLVNMMLAVVLMRFIRRHQDGNTTKRV